MLNYIKRMYTLQVELHKPENCIRKRLMQFNQDFVSTPPFWKITKLVQCNKLLIGVIPTNALEHFVSIA